MSDNLTIWGLSVQFCQNLVLSANVFALVCGTLTGAALYVSAKLSSNIADVIQQNADKQIGEAQTRGDEARAEAAKANERTAGLEKEAAELRLALEREQATHLPRTIKPDQREKISESLRQFSGQEFIIVSYVYDPDAVTTNKLIATMLIEAGWKRVADLETVLPNSSPGVRIYFNAHAEDSTKEAAKVLVSLLNGANIAADVIEPAQILNSMVPKENNHLTPEHQIYIDVGPKPWLDTGK